MDPILKSIGEYWGACADGLEIDGAKWGSPEFFTEIKILHDRAYGYANRIPDFEQLRGLSISE